jgi:hypothetical protein
MTDSTIKDDLILLQNKKIFFGHQSVGNNILQGLKEIISKHNDIKLNIIQPQSANTQPEGFFAEAMIGQNTMPETKLRDFDQKIGSYFNGDLDLALMKFCYVDINAETNVEALFDIYKSAYESLKTKYPKIKFVHVTVPLTERPRGVKHFIKTLLGREKSAYMENFKRNVFNEFIKQTYGTEPIFDLAGVESTYPDGSRETLEIEGWIFYALISDYTNDGGHLNETGGRLAAEGLIKTLSAAVR